MVTPDVAREVFARGLEYGAYVETGTPDQRASWGAVHKRVALPANLRELLGAMTRTVNILTLSGTWCGDCVQQVPILDHAVRAAKPGVLRLRLVDRDEEKTLSDMVRICGGNRVPTAIFLNEDFEFLSLYGDKSISRLRAIAARSLGASCPVPGAPIADDELAATQADWVQEIERAHLIARLSPRLRQRHGD